MSPPADILCFSHLRWDFVFQRPQHLMTRCAREHRVFFFEEPIYDSADPGLVITTDRSGVRVVTPHLPGRPEDDLMLRSGLLDALVRDQKLNDFVSWYDSPRALAWSRQLLPRAVVYDCMEPSVSELQERELLRRADLVFTSDHRLSEARRPLHANVHALPNGIDLPHFAAARRVRAAPDDQAHLPHPRLGFCGAIDDHLDLELVGELASRRPEWQIILLGPVMKAATSRLPRAHNIHYLGPKRDASLPDYFSGWDVALLPGTPTRTLEYLAAGLPVVSTSADDGVQPEALVHLARSAAEFEEAVVQGLEEDRASRELRADAYLAGLSWEHTWSQMKAELARLFTPVEAPRRRKPRFDYLIAGAGFSGSVMAERLAEHGKKVLLVDKRDHLGGNAFDLLDAAGVLVHKYGPQIFHTNSDDVFDYLSRFTEWRPYEHRVLAQVGDRLLPIPINLDTINTLYGWDLDPAQLAEYFARIAVPLAEIRTSEDVIVARVGRALSETFFRNDTFKQWGLYPSQLDPSVIGHIAVRTNRDDRFFTDTHQAMPAQGYTALFKRMLDHRNITVELGTDYRDAAQRVIAHELVYTGPIDEYFGHCFGALPYRSVDFRFETLNEALHQPVAVIHHPNQHDYTRVTEFKHLTGQQSAKTTLVYEYPTEHGEPYHPVPRPENAARYDKYQALAQRTAGVHFVGRLATYRNDEMDQCVAQALALASKLMGVRRAQRLEGSA